MNQQNLADLLWNVADTLRGPFKPSLYGRIILPFTVLRRLECVLEPTREAVRERHTALSGTGVDLDLVLPNIAGASFYNTSKFSLATLGSTSTRANLEEYISKFSANARQIFEHFGFDQWLHKLETANLLYLVTQKFATQDLHPGTISNHEMGLVFEHLIRKFAEAANDDAGEYFTPRDVVLRRGFAVAFRLRHISSRDLCIDDRLDRETLSAQRTRDSLSDHPFYGARAEQARARGDDWSYWRSVAGFTYVPSPEESAALTAQRERRDELARIHCPKAQANMASKAWHLPPLSMALSEAAHRFGLQTAALSSMARREGCEAELCELLVHAIESGEFPKIYAFMDRVLVISAAKARGDSPHIESTA